ncbi:MAG TPA: type I-U CRISPR-associated protein Csx17, partial [Desulfohalobiaceae bacterium]|nr:type I-U CRISPR-associated protein Csx17 [Desulfohalobiaceae bacterium]
PDDMLPWLDACYLITTEGRKFTPLLGTGGNEGSGSYVAGFSQQVVSCIVHRLYDQALSEALFAHSIPEVASQQTPGHFSPSAAGWANAADGFEGQITTNPWDYLLCMEGTLLFAASATRKLQDSQAGSLSYPFTVRTFGGGYGSAAVSDESEARAEMWLPLWNLPVNYPELKTVLGE